MKLEIINGIRVITPNADKWLYSEADKVISDKVWLGVNADAETWEEITTEEKENLEALWNEESEVFE